MAMSKNTKIMLGVAALGAGYYFFVYQKKAVPLAVVAYDGQTHNINVEQGLSAAAKTQIANFFSATGTLANSLNPAQDDATIVASLKSQGFPTAAASVDALYQSLQTTANANLTSGYSAGRLRTGTYYGRDSGALVGVEPQLASYGAGLILRDRMGAGASMVERRPGFRSRAMPGRLGFRGQHASGFRG